MRHASLFSGIGGPEVAAAMLGWENVFHCEINEFGRKVLEYWFPNSESYEDITKTDFRKFRGTIDVLTGGFPCQPFSYAGKRGGQQDQRYLWPEMLRVINEVRPTWVIGENVAGIGTMVEQCRITDLGSEVTLFEKGSGLHRYTAEFTFTIERICSDLESEGYSVQPMLIPACAVGAPHRRDRIFFIAHYTDSCNDLRESGQHESESGKERLSERNEVRKPGEPSDVRSEGEESAENSMRDGLFSRLAEEQRDKRNEWNTCSRDNEWICGKERLDFTDTDCNRRGEIHQYLQSEFSDGTESVCNGRKWNAADTKCKGLQEWMSIRLCENREEEEARVDNRTERFGYNGRTTRMLPTERWEGFPSVSPVHRGNDGLPFDVDKLAIPFGKWRTESIKAYGNAIVPQVMYRIFEVIEALEKI